MMNRLSLILIEIEALEIDPMGNGWKMRFDDVDVFGNCRRGNGTEILIGEILGAA